MNEKLKSLLDQTALDYLPADLYFTTEKKYTTPAHKPGVPFPHNRETKIKRYNYSGIELRIPYKPISRMIRDESCILLATEIFPTP